MDVADCRRHMRTRLNLHYTGCIKAKQFIFILDVVYITPLQTVRGAARVRLRFDGDTKSNPTYALPGKTMCTRSGLKSVPTSHSA